MKEEIQELKQEIIVLLKRVNDLEMLLGEIACANEGLSGILAESLLHCHRVRTKEALELLNSQVKRLEEIDAPKGVIEQKIEQKRIVEHFLAKLDRAKPNEYLKHWKKQQSKAQRKMLLECTTTGWDIPDAFKLIFGDKV